MSIWLSSDHIVTDRYLHKICEFVNCIVVYGANTFLALENNHNEGVNRIKNLGDSFERFEQVIVFLDCFLRVIRINYGSTKAD